jgi:hypothetical protein
VLCVVCCVLCVVCCVLCVVCCVLCVGCVLCVVCSVLCVVCCVLYTPTLHYCEKKRENKREQEQRHSWTCGAHRRLLLFAFLLQGTSYHIR